MSGLQSNLEITATDKTGAAFKSVEARVKALDKNIGSVAKTIDTIDQVAKSVAPVSEKLGAAAAQVRKVTAATRELVAEETRLAEAGARLKTFQTASASLEDYEQKLVAANLRFRELLGTFAQSSNPTKSLAREVERAEAAVKELTSATAAQSAQVLSARASFEELAGPLDSVAAAEGRLAAEVGRVNVALERQKGALAQGSGQLQRSIAEQEAVARRSQAFWGHVTGEVLPFAGPEILHGTIHAIEQGAEVEQMKFRIGQMGGGAEEANFADTLAGQVAASNPYVTRVKALDNYQELRANSVNQDGTLNRERARANMQTAADAQVAAAALGIEMTPRDMQNLLKSVESSGRANDPDAFRKTADAYLKAKQMYGSAISSDALLTYVQNAKAANFTIGDSAFYGSTWARLAEGNSARLGNEISQSMSTLVGGKMLKQSAQWLVAHGLIKQNQIHSGGGGKFYISGQIAGGDMMQSDPTAWAPKYMVPAIESTGALREDKVRARMNSDRAQDLKTNPQDNTPEAVRRERAEAALISAELYKSGFRGTVVDQLARAIANERLIERDTEAMKKNRGILARDDIAKNPVAAYGELTNALESFGSTVTSPAVKAIAPALDSIARDIAGLSEAFDELKDWSPGLGEAVSGAVTTAALAGGGYLSYKLLSGFAHMFGGGKMNGVAAELNAMRQELASVSGKLGGAAEEVGELATASKRAAITIGELSTAAGLAYAAWKGASGLWDLLKKQDDKKPGSVDWLQGQGPYGVFGDDLKGGKPTLPNDWLHRLLRFDFGPPPGVQPLPPEYFVPPTDWRAPYNAPIMPSPLAASPLPVMAAQRISTAVEVTGHAQAETTVKVEAGSSLLSIFNSVQHLISEIPLLGHGTGRMDSDAAPNRGGVGHM